MLDRRSMERWLTFVIVTALGLYLVIGVAIWGWLIVDGRAVPAAFGTVLAAIAGGFLSFLGSVWGRRNHPPLWYGDAPPQSDTEPVRR